MAKYIKNCYEPEGTIKERLTGINIWCYYNTASGKNGACLQKFLVSKGLVEGCSECFK